MQHLVASDLPFETKDSHFHSEPLQSGSKYFGIVEFLVQIHLVTIKTKHNSYNNKLDIRVSPDLPSNLKLIIILEN